AIVGPNGSGKSNIADALKWALGEQSMKTLRGKKSEDIIFAGSGKKSQLGSAQVLMHLDNSSKKIPIDYEDLVISRKIYRSGESEYLINGSKVRLLDIVDILAKAGIGQRSYCIINQGMADHVLNATPVERRVMIEEAAGVKEHQIKKDRSERKLKSTKINIERVKGLLTEIEPHLNMLRRQSQKAAKGDEYRENLKRKQNELFGFLWNKIQTEKNQSAGIRDDFSKKIMINQREIDEIQDKLSKESGNKANYNLEIQKLEGEERKINYSLNDLERKLIVEQGKMELERERQKEVKMIETIPVDSGFIKTRLEDLQKRQKALVGKISAIKKIEELGELEKYAKKISIDITELHQGIIKGKIEKKKQSDELQKIQKESDERIAKMQNIVDKIEKERNEVESNKNKIREKISELIKKDQDERQEMIKLEDQLRRKQFETDKVKDQFNDYKLELAKLEVREEDLQIRIEKEMKVAPEKIGKTDVSVDVNKWEHDIERLKFQLEQVGAIDETILQEYQETQERYDFLKKESEDLEDAIKSLRKVIKEMNQNIKGSFEETFRNINKKFSEYFKIIFDGGKAELIRVEIQKRVNSKNLNENEDETDLDLEEVDEDDVQVGIEINACPPGKKISNLGMLSGGERALTSIALLFAIISHNPPPFAILDEVEAALDEANSQRFGKILRQLSNKTQFVLVTHNRQTMKEAAVLYGVSMNDDGISQLLSVQLDQVGEEGEIKK
nr:AAA family ATPase [Patescibacteria group bacterium]